MRSPDKQQRKPEGAVESGVKTSPKVEYSNFEWFATHTPFDCPLCGTHVPPGQTEEV